MLPFPNGCRQSQTKRPPLQSNNKTPHHGLLLVLLLLLSVDFVPPSSILTMAANATVSTLAGKGPPTKESGFVDGNGTLTARFNTPHGIATLPNGNLVVADYNNHAIRLITMPNGVVSTLAGKGPPTGQPGLVDGDGTLTARFNWPVGIATLPNGNLVAADYNNHAIRLITMPNGVVSTLAGKGPPTGERGFVDGTGTLTARFYLPHGITTLPNGNLVVADTYNNAIRLIAMPNGVVSTLAGRGPPTSQSGFVDGTGTPLTARFNLPSGIATLPNGNLVVADTYNHAIRLITMPNGVVSTLAGKGPPTGERGFVDGTGTLTARFSIPYGIATFPNGNLVVADRDNHAIRLITMPDGVVSTLAGKGPPTGEMGFVDGNGALTARFNHPVGIAVLPNGNLVVADTDNHAIRLIPMPPAAQRNTPTAATPTLSNPTLSLSTGALPASPSLSLTPFPTLSLSGLSSSSSSRTLSGSLSLSAQTTTHHTSSASPLVRLTSRPRPRLSSGGRRLSESFTMERLNKLNPWNRSRTVSDSHSRVLLLTRNPASVQVATLDPLTKASVVASVTTTTGATALASTVSAGGLGTDLQTLFILGTFRCNNSFLKGLSDEGHAAIVPLRVGPKPLDGLLGMVTIQGTVLALHLTIAAMAFRLMRWESLSEGMRRTGFPSGSIAFCFSLHQGTFFEALRLWAGDTSPATAGELSGSVGLFVVVMGPPLWIVIWAVTALRETFVRYQLVFRPMPAILKSGVLPVGYWTAEQPISPMLRSGFGGYVSRPYCLFGLTGMVRAFVTAAVSVLGRNLDCAVRTWIVAGTLVGTALLSLILQPFNTRLTGILTTLSSLVTATVVVLSQFSGMDQVVQWLTVALTGTTLLGTVLLLIVKLLTIRWRAREDTQLAEGKGGLTEDTDSTGIPLELSSFSSSTNDPTHPHHDSGGAARTLSYPLLTMPSTNSNPRSQTQTLSPLPLQGKSKYHSANSSSGYNPLLTGVND
jgi:hypothetical protein